MEISSEQHDYLLGFYAHCFTVYHHNGKADFGFWAEQLDNANIPWSVQNNVAVLAEDRETIQYYLRTLLKQKGVTVH